MSATHNDLIQIDINLAAPPATSTDFAAMAFFAIDQPFGSGARSKSYQSYSALNADSANLSANALAAGLAAFSQSRAPSVFTVVHVDDIGGETYADAWDAFVVTGVSFFLVATESRAVADHEDIAGRLESYKKAFGCFQSSAIVTAGTVDKTAYDAFKAREYSMGIYHDTDTEWHDVALLASRGTFDLDQISNTYTGRISVPSTPDIDDTAKLALKAQTVGTPAESTAWNVALPMSVAPAYVDTGKNFAGTPVYEIISVIWFKDRLQARLQALKLSYDDRGAKLPLNRAGQEAVKSEVRAQFKVGEDAGHFQAGKDADGVRYNDISMPDPIPAADIADQTMTGTGYATILSGARIIDLEFNFTR